MMAALDLQGTREQAARALAFVHVPHARRVRILDNYMAAHAHALGIAAGNRQPRYYNEPAPGTDPARGPFAPVERRKSDKRRRQP